MYYVTGKFNFIKCSIIYKLKQYYPIIIIIIYFTHFFIKIKKKSTNNY